ncbi:MAG TPA: glycerol-3-phosphate dehydrogenase/oxidase [Desulfopila sp.]|nr:glycerol-3-phosphate dehydrogenase/oxidase [Desulfopila sp.]
MKRDISKLADTVFDAVVIGGGIHGATIFFQLASAGVKVALIEKNDFGGATSANSLKILHGGLRYLQHLNIKRMRESINSRKYFMQMAPHLIKPMPCIMPTYGLGMQGQPVMGLAMLLFDIISWDRNRNAPPENRVGRGRLLTRSQCLKIGPGIAPEGLTGAALWYDDLITSTERMSLEFIKRGCQYTGNAANYLEATKLSRAGNRITGMEVTDRMNGNTFTLRCRTVINAAGPWVDTIKHEFHQAGTTEKLAKAVNIVIRKPLFNGYGVGLAGRDEFIDQDAKIKRGKRLYFFAPWKNRTIIGTTYRYYEGQYDDLQVSSDDIKEILDEVNAIYPHGAVTVDDVIFTHAGLMPAHAPKAGDYSAPPQLVKHSRIIDHAELENLEGLLTIEGVKYTTAPAIARRIEKQLRKKNLLPAAPHGGRFDSDSATLSPHEQNLITSYGGRFPHIADNFGHDAVKVYEIMATEAGGANNLTRDNTLVKAEVLFCVREEMAVKLADIILRRTDCGTTGCPGRDELDQIASVMAEELGWSDDRTAHEKELVMAHFHTTLGIPT